MLAARQGPPAIRRKNTLGDIASWVGQKIGLTSTGFWGSFFGEPNWAGEHVTVDKAMQLSAVWRAVNLTATTQATLPKSMYEDTAAGPVRADGGPSDALLREPNAEQTDVEFWEQILGLAELTGNGIARKFTVGARVVALEPMPGVAISRNVQGALQYRWRDETGKEVGPLNPDEVFHLRGFSLGGRVGMSTVRYGAQTMGLAIAGEKAAGTLFRSGLRASGFLNTGQVLEEEDRKRLQGIINEYVGAASAGSVMLLEGGMQFSPLSMSAEDAELLLTRKFQIEEIGRWFGLPPILLGHAVDGQTMWGSGVDAIIQAWLTLGLNQRVVRLERRWAKDILTPAQRARFYPKVNTDALLRVNSASRASFLSTLVQNGLMDRDEARALLELGKRPGGDVLTAQVNLVPLDQLGQNDSAGASALKAATRRFLGLDDDPNPPPAIAA